MRQRLLAISLLAVLAGCSSHQDDHAAPAPAAPAAASTAAKEPPPASTDADLVKQHMGDYATVRLTADLSAFDEKQKQMIALLVQAADVTNSLYWQQSWGDKNALMQRISDEDTRRYAEINYGPWDRLNNDEPFVAGVGPRPPGVQFYPADMTKDEFEKSDLKDKTSLYTVIRRDASGALVSVPFHEAYKTDLEKAAGLLRQAAELSSDKDFARYLKLRADALLSDDYRPSDFAWMAMKKNPVDIVIGPIETYEDQLFGYKASYESYVLVKDQAWSAKLSRFVKYLPELQRELPVDAKYKAEKPGSDADLNAYFAVYYAGDANVGAKTIAINLPNDEEVQLKKGTRRLQLENVMQAKFDKIMLPIAKELIADDQQSHLTFDAFFENTMFHEVAHGLGIKQTLTGKGMVRGALKDQASSFEEGKADILGLYMVSKLAEKGELDKAKLMDNYVTFLAGILRSVRFGASDAHAKANMVRFNFFKQQGAFTRDATTGRYRVDFDKMTAAMNALSSKLLTIQGDGDYDAAKQLTDSMGSVDAELAGDLKRLSTAKIPVDISFEQGLDVLGVAAPAAK
ncbi:MULTISPECIES: dipeptidyl-peptidase 3 family protein [Dyella]|uniref:Zn-dependent hydrolase n=2 Tax=Dyella TaxID=231454 RepID=A0A4R0YD14_9GAMM|nr:MULTISPECIES: Zn-dependent hydrolase [Dyella]TBR36241.1 Zn-dependent hydrolase [Dyella terrae]TCI05898.1 Zn-dependent hydrolase [Dyella soli]